MENLYDDYALQMLASHGLIPAIKKALSEYENGNSKLDDFVDNVRLILNGYDKVMGIHRGTT